MGSRRTEPVQWVKRLGVTGIDIIDPEITYVEYTNDTLIVFYYTHTPNPVTDSVLFVILYPRRS